MSHSVSRLTGLLRGAALGLLGSGLMTVSAHAPEAMAAGATAVAAQDADAAQQAPPVVSSEIGISRDRAELTLELRDGRSLMLALDGGRVLIDGDDVDSYERGDELDRSWRDLLGAAITRPDPAELSALLAGWVPPAGADALRDALTDALTAEAEAEATEPAAPEQEAAPDDSVRRLEDRIAELERELREREREVSVFRATPTQPARTNILRPFRHIVSGLGRILSTLMLYAVLAGIGFATVYFGQRHLEGVADTARRSTVRAGLVGLATSFLLLPAFVIGTIALAISIVGIPLIVVWVVALPLAVALAVLLGYIGVAHAAGEAFAERRFYKNNWFEHANSYYYVLTGFALLLALFLGAHVIGMAGPWLGFLRGTLYFLGVVVTGTALMVGLGAVVISRAGTRRPELPTVDPDVSEPLEEESHV